MTEFFVSIALILCTLAAFFFWRPAALLAIAVVAVFVLAGCTGDDVQPSCEDLERSILAKDICARLRNCELTMPQIEQWMRESRAYRLYCAQPERAQSENKLPSIS